MGPAVPQPTAPNHLLVWFPNPLAAGSGLGERRGQMGTLSTPSGMLEGSDGLDSHVAQPSGILKHLFQSQTVTRGPAVPNQR